MGAVFEAHDLRTGRTVALKVLYAEYASEAGWRRRFVREARAAAAIRHPNIVDVLDVDVDGPLPFIAMELLSGETLGDLITREHTLPLVHAAHLLIPVCSAVHAAHRGGIVHRDLKPENIFLATQGGRETPFVLDFGIAKVTAMGQVTEAQGALTQTGAVLGTPHFMAPEQMLNEEEVDHRVDVWALGVMLFYALSGQRPYAGINLAQILKSVLMSTHARLDELVPTMPKDVVDVVHACLMVKKDARPDGVDQIAAVLAPYAGVAPPVRMHRSNAPRAHQRGSTPGSSLEGDKTAAIMPLATTPATPVVAHRSGARSLIVGGVALALVLGIGAVIALPSLRGKEIASDPAPQRPSSAPSAATPAITTAANPANPANTEPTTGITGSTGPSTSSTPSAIASVTASTPKPTAVGTNGKVAPRPSATASVVPSVVTTTAPTPTGIVEKAPF